MQKSLSVNTDFYDNILVNDRFFSQANIEQMMAYCRQLGADTVDWIYDDMWAMYDSYPGGLDLLRVAVDAAHQQGMRFHAVYKPDEGSLVNVILPQTMPRPAAAPVWQDLRGLAPIVRPFVAANPQFCMARQPGDTDPGGAITSIRLIKNDADAVTLQPSDISIYTSAVNGTFSRYDGSFTLQTSVDWRPLFPLGKDCRIITLTGLNIPAAQTYIELRFSDTAFGGQQFRNEYLHLVELVRADGSIVPATVAAAAPCAEHYVKMLAKPVMRQLTRYGQHPEVAAFLDDPDQISAQAGEMRAYARAVHEGDRIYRLDEKRLLSIARGKVEHIPGRLNCIYPEVRQEWLRTTRRLIEAGVDAVDFRSTAHMPPQEAWAYGFNQPVLDKLDGRVDIAGAKQIIGDAFTGFLREARDLLHAHGKQIGVHLMTNFLVHRDEGLATPDTEMQDFQWETWVAEIADFAQMRGAMGMRESTLRYTIERFAGACQKAGVPLTYQSNRRYFARVEDRMALPQERLRGLEYEIALALAHPGVTSYQLYETAGFSQLDDQGNFQGNQQLVELCRRQGFGLG